MAQRAQPFTITASAEGGTHNDSMKLVRDFTENGWSSSATVVPSTKTDGHPVVVFALIPDQTALETASERH